MLSIMAGESTTRQHRRYSTVTGYFLQDDTDTIANAFDYTVLNFGLKRMSGDLDSGKTQWQMLEERLNLMNKKSGPQVSYKLLFLGRHGQGVHNVAEHYYGTNNWDCKWSKLEGNGTLYWVDAHLTATGIKQAQAVSRFWSVKIEEEKIPTPQTYYTSPLDRCLATAKLTFANLKLLHDRPFAPIVKEHLRETNGVHTCDRRSSRSYIHEHYPSYNIEPGFTEDDELWLSNLRESNAALDARLKMLLDDIFKHDQSTFTSLTSHSGAIAGILRVIGHREFRLVTGSVIPVLVRAEIIYGVEDEKDDEPGIPAVGCAKVG